MPCDLYDLPVVAPAPYLKVGSKKKKVCEECADRLREEAEIAEDSESVVQQMMGYKGRR